MVKIGMLNKAVMELDKGEKIYINAIGLSLGAVDKLRNYIKKGVLLPYRPEVERAYKDVESVMNGNVIFPQMVYIKQ